VVDLSKAEEDTPDATDIPIAYMPHSKKITLLQLDGKVEAENLKKVIKLGIEGCKKIYEIQKQALKEKYASEEIEEETYE